MTASARTAEPVQPLICHHVQSVALPLVAQVVRLQAQEAEAAVAEQTSQALLERCISRIRVRKAVPSLSLSDMVRTLMAMADLIRSPLTTVEDVALVEAETEASARTAGRHYLRVHDSAMAAATRLNEQFPTHGSLSKGIPFTLFS